MKKFGIAVLSIAAAGCLLLAGCSKKNDDDNTMETMDDKVTSMATDMATQAKNFLTDIRDDIKGRAKELEAKIELGSMGSLDAIEENGNTIKYRFNMVGEGIKMDKAKMEEKANKLADEAGASLKELKDKGIDNAKVVVEFVDDKGNELYSKVFQ